VPLAIAIALDTYVAATRAFASQTIAAALAVAAILALAGFWYAYPMLGRIRRERRPARLNLFDATSASTRGKSARPAKSKRKGEGRPIYASCQP
jgi:hypothetical protein